MRWCSTALPVLADGDGTIHPAARAFEERYGGHLDFDAATRKFVPVSWPVEEDETAMPTAWRAIVRGTRDYCAKNGFDKVWIGLSVASIRRSCWRSRSMRSARRAVTGIACRRATPRASATTSPTNRRARSGELTV